MRASRRFGKAESSSRRTPRRRICSARPLHAVRIWPKRSSAIVNLQGASHEHVADRLDARRGPFARRGARWISHRDRSNAAEDLADARPGHVRRPRDRDANRTDRAGSHDREWSPCSGGRRVAGGCGRERWRTRSVDCRRCGGGILRPCGTGGRNSLANATVAPVAFALQPGAERRRLLISGVVQGVGFRPFVHRLAEHHGLDGHVCNTGNGVEVEVEGPSAAVDEFVAALVPLAPTAAAVDEVVETRLALVGSPGFRIVASYGHAHASLIGADLATCPECLAELFDPADRRFKSPFLACTACGPRFTVVQGLPYDRARTTLSTFPLCSACRGEYVDPADRRFHAEAIACPVCGPQLSMPLEEAVAQLHA